MNKSHKIAIVAGSALVLFAVIVVARYLYSEINRLKVGEPLVTIEKTATTTATETTTSTAEEILIESTSTGPVEFKSPDDWTTFVLPEGTRLSNPFNFYGTTTAFENSISWRLLDENGVQISFGFTQVNSPDIGIPGPFTVEAFFDTVPATKKGKLQIYEASAEDGEPIHVAEADVSFPNETQITKVFFGNTDKATEGEECETVYPVERMTVKGDALQIAIHELLKGPNLLEANSGYYTSIPESVPHPEILYKDEGTRLDFTQALQNQVGGSCRVLHIRKQIQETFKEASSDESVTISIDGRTDDILQP
ncbi:MAG: Gmad2 immunoglobulin-like domain-containing protein [Patescibacteria group bacterium]|nr:Gmad2 immunoglobulin-like domain-containing protein [Patescibacteria group bacterium]